MALRKKIIQLANSFINIPVIGIDISDLSIKFAAFDSKNPTILKFFDEIDIPEGIIKDGEISDEQALAQILSSWFKKEGGNLSSFFVALSLPEEKSFLRIIQLPKVKQDLVENAVRFEIEANIPLAPEELAYGYEVIEPLEDHLDHIDIMITAFPKKIVQSYVNAIKQANLNIIILESESQAIVRAIIPNPRSRGAKIIVDIGQTRTSLILFAGGAIIFTSTFKLGGKDIENNIAKNLNVNLEKAWQIKKESGMDKKLYEGELFSAIVPIISALADELKRALTFYQEHLKHTHGAASAVDEILLVGGDSNLKGLDTYLASTTKIPVKIADVFANISNFPNKIIPQISRNDSLSYATVIGLTSYRE